MVAGHCRRRRHRNEITRGELTSLQCSTRDIQRRHEAEAALRDSHADLHLAMVPERQRSIVTFTGEAAVTGDRRLLRSLLQNLLANALRSSEDARAIHIEVSARRDATTWPLEVTDDGDGIDVTLQVRLFEPFARMQRLGRPHGHGLGLPICLRIVERHRGQLRVEYLDPGTRFTLVVQPTAQVHGTNDT